MLIGWLSALKIEKKMKYEILKKIFQTVQKNVVSENCSAISAFPIIFFKSCMPQGHQSSSVPEKSLNV